MMINNNERVKAVRNSIIQCWRFPPQTKDIAPPGGLEPPTFRLTAERASRLRHGGYMMTNEFCLVAFLGIQAYRCVGGGSMLWKFPDNNILLGDIS